jgi:hypothetical protein
MAVNRWEGEAGAGKRVLLTDKSGEYLSLSPSLSFLLSLSDREPTLPMCLRSYTTDASRQRESMTLHGVRSYHTSSAVRQKAAGTLYDFTAPRNYGREGGERERERESIEENGERLAWGSLLLCTISMFFLCSAPLSEETTSSRKVSDTTAISAATWHSTSPL